MVGKTAVWVLMGILALQTSEAFAATGNSGTGSAPPGVLSCPPDFLTAPEQKMFAKEGAIRSGPWHIRCFQNGTGIFDRDHIYLFCQKGDTTTALETADGHAIRFQFPPEIACTWER